MNLESDLNYYDLLEVTPTSGLEEIREAYQRLRHFYATDPQFRQSFSEAEVQTIILTLDEAFLVLTDPTRKEAYERAINRIWPEQSSKKDDLSLIGSEGARRIDDPIEEVSLQAHYPIPATGADGAYFKQLREDAGLSLDEVSAITRIGIHHLVSIENDKLSNLPAPVFVRGFVIQLAKTFGLEEKLIADSYMVRFKKLRRK